jgi:hypothetical protein
MMCMYACTFTPQEMGLQNENRNAVRQRFILILWQVDCFSLPEVLNTIYCANEDDIKPDKYMLCLQPFGTWCCSQVRQTLLYSSEQNGETCWRSTILYTQSKIPRHNGGSRSALQQIIRLDILENFPCRRSALAEQETLAPFRFS